MLPRMRALFLGLVIAVATSSGGPLERVHGVELPLRRRPDLAVPAGWPKPPAARHADEVPAKRVRLRVDEAGLLGLTLLDGDGQVLVRARPFPRRWILPHLPDGARGQPFDDLLLRLAEFSRLGVRVPALGDGDLDVLVANNCLRAGLWEVTLHRGDRRHLHGWFEVPRWFYLGQASAAAGIDPLRARRALAWDPEPVAAQMDRLRRVVRELGGAPVRLDPGFAFQAIDQEQAAKRGKWHAGRAGVGPSTARLEDLHVPVHFADFIEPGRYTPWARRAFDLGFLLEPGQARFREVEPPDGSAKGRLEVDFELGPYRVVIGNLDRARLGSERTRFHGFGVAVAGPRDHAADHVAREGSADRWAYALLLDDQGRAMNAHAVGIETLDLRIRRGTLEVVIGSFERITSLVRLRMELPGPAVP